MTYRKTVFALASLFVAACSGGKSSSQQCSSNGDCAAAQVCVDHDCHDVCANDLDCASDSICEQNICTTGTRSTLAPVITAVNGDGTNDGAASHTANRTAGHVTITGERLDGAAVKLSDATHQWDLYVCSNTGTEMVVELPTALASGGNYTLSVASQAGSCDAILPVLQGEQGPQGPMPIVATGGGLVGDGSSTSPISIDLSRFDGVMRPCSDVGTSTYNATTGAWSACDGYWDCSSTPTHAGCVSSSAYTSCKAIHDDPAFQGGDGVYWIDVDGAAGAANPAQVVCDMHFAGGGWTLAMNIDTSDGHYVHYENTAFWQDLATGEGIVGVALTADYKSPEVFDALTAHDIMIVVHEEGIPVAWRSWELDTPASASSFWTQPENTTLASFTTGSGGTYRLNQYETVVRPAGELVVNQKYGLVGTPDHARVANNACAGFAVDDAIHGLGTLMNNSSGSRWDAGYGGSGYNYTNALIGNDQVPGGPWTATNLLGLYYDYAIYVR